MLLMTRTRLERVGTVLLEQSQFNIPMLMACLNKNSICDQQVKTFVCNFASASPHHGHTTGISRPFKIGPLNVVGLSNQMSTVL